MPTRLNATISFFLLFSSFKQPQSFIFFFRITCTDMSFSVKNCNFSDSWTEDGTAEVENDIKLKSKFAANFLKFQDNVYEVMPRSVRE